MANLITPFRTPAPPAGTPSQLSTYTLAPAAISSVRLASSSAAASELNAIKSQITSPGQPAPARMDPGAIQLFSSVPASSFAATPVSTAPFVPPAVRRSAPALPPVNGGAGSSSDQMLKPTPPAPTNMFDDGGAFHVPQLGPGPGYPGEAGQIMPVYADGSSAAGLQVQPLQQWQLEHRWPDVALRLGLPVAAVLTFKRNKGIAAALAAGAAVLWANRLGAVRL